MDAIGLLVLRLVAGGYIMRWGVPKLRDANGQFDKEFESAGFHPANVFVKRAGSVEVLAGALIALGLLGPTGPMLLLSDMLVATSSTTASERAFKPDQHEDELLYASIALLLALSGPGELSLDSALGIRFFDQRWVRALSVAGAVAGAAMMFSTRAPSQTRSSHE